MRLFSQYISQSTINKIFFVNADVIDSLAEYEFIKQTEMDDILSLLIKTAL